MGLIRGLPSHVEEQVAQIADEDGVDYLTVVQDAMRALRASRTERATRGTVVIPLGGDIEAMRDTDRFGLNPRWCVGNQHMRVTFDCVSDVPTVDEMDAMRRIYESAGEALELHEHAYLLAHPIPRREVTSMTGMDPGPSGPGLPVPDDATSDLDEPSGEPE